MTEQGLREKIAKRIFRADGGKVAPTWEQVLNHEYYLREADSIISLIKADGWMKISGDQLVCMKPVNQLSDVLQEELREGK